MSDPKVQPRPAPRPRFKLEQYARLGDVVDWFPGGDVAQAPIAAVVTAEHHETAVTVNVVDPSLRDVVPMSGVLHVDDPMCQKLGTDVGGWRHRPETVATRGLLVALGLAKFDRGENEFVVLDAGPLADRLGQLRAPEAAKGPG